MSTIARAAAFVALLAVASLYLITGFGVSTRSGTVTYSKGSLIGLGDTPAGEQIVEFEVHNRSSTPIRVERVRGSCTCTEIIFPLGVIEAGQTRQCIVKIKIRPGTSDTAYLFFHFDAPQGRVDSVGITFRGVSRGEVSSSVPVVSIADQYPGQRIEGTVEVRHRDSDSSSEAGAHRWSLKPEGKLRILTSDVRIRGAECVYTLRFAAGPLGAGESIMGVAELSIGDPEIARAEVSVRISVRAGLRVEPSVLDAVVRDDSERDVGKFVVDLPKKWKLLRVETPDWLRAEELHVSERKVEFPIRLATKERRQFYAGEVFFVIDAGLKAPLRCPAQVVVEDRR